MEEFWREGAAAEAGRSNRGLPGLRHGEGAQGVGVVGLEEAGGAGYG
jgi:hypothetical protein